MSVVCTTEWCELKGVPLPAYRWPVTCACGRRFVHEGDTGSNPDMPPTPTPLKDSDVQKLFPGETDPTLIGERIAALTKAIGIPPCGDCHKRRKWLNKAHEWIRGKFGYGA